MNPKPTIEDAYMVLEEAGLIHRFENLSVTDKRFLDTIRDPDQYREHNLEKLAAGIGLFLPKKNQLRVEEYEEHIRGDLVTRLSGSVVTLGRPRATPKN